MENNETIVKQKSNKGVIILLVIIIIILLGISGYLAYDKFMAKDIKTNEVTETQTKEESKNDNTTSQIIDNSDKDYSGYYKGCSKDEYGDENCVELVLNKDKTAFLLENPISASGVVGNYSINNDEIIINSIYQISSENAGIKNNTYNLKIDNDEFIYSYNNINYKLTKTTEDKLTLYNQMKSVK